jgi:hypothetical protein
MISIRSYVPLSFVLFLCLISSIPSVYAAEDDGVNFMDFPQYLSEAIGIPVFAAQLLISTILLFAVLLPCAIWAKSSLVAIIVGFSMMGILVALQWLPYWFLLLIALIVALIYAKELKGSVGGESP